MASNTSKKKRGLIRLSKGAEEARYLKLRDDTTIIGRERADIVISDEEMSSTHCQIQRIGVDYHVFDMNSTNGTFVNQERVIKAKLRHGDLIEIGKTKIAFELLDEKAAKGIQIRDNYADSAAPRKTVLATLMEQRSAAGESALFELLVRYPNGVKETIAVKNFEILIGRITGVGQFERDTEISRKHLIIRVNNEGRVFIEDQGSTNGTYVNGERVLGMKEVDPSDRIKVGNTEISVKRADAVDQKST